ncbi:hypothetical protein KY290_018071 [Solanum tuberosum]|uniref:Uncharacterized protein n=1 Tax=Solanum tuberosum TaxID=4113 RepID=A0ABQ7VD57_SOLTU|nr:hypothetical protein KY289_014978 [Solanum tuberosum]KAH0697497.1 hypothetical protein KY289_014979 [Solanum tuberosum]KAH0761997.1 hypothetical protein KY290_018070 [Solanum tuberosum]KAH0761998.1 hypothetical protein KY290_018071 [Solanum tuberosum]
MGGCCRAGRGSCWNVYSRDGEEDREHRGQLLFAVFGIATYMFGLKGKKGMEPGQFGVVWAVFCWEFG